MAGLNIGKRDVAKIADVLDQDYDSAEDAARAVLEECFALYETKAKFTVVGQLAYSPEGGWMNRADALASMVALGNYGTEKAAYNDALSFTISSATHEEFKAWVLPVYHGTPASYFSKRKTAKNEAVLENSTAARFGKAREKSLAEIIRDLQGEGWPDDAQIMQRREGQQTCPECGLIVEGEHHGLASGYEVAS